MRKLRLEVSVSSLTMSSGLARGVIAETVENLGHLVVRNAVPSERLITPSTHRLPAECEVARSQLLAQEPPERPHEVSCEQGADVVVRVCRQRVAGR